MSIDFAQSDFSLQLARKHVDAYSESDRVMTQHAVAMACRDCEDFLDSGIQAYKWLVRSDELVHTAAREGISVSSEVIEAIEVLYRQWLTPCLHAEERIRQQMEAGFTIANLNEFRDACENVKKRVYAIDMNEVLDSAFSGQVFDASFWAEADKLRAL